MSRRVLPRVLFSRGLSQTEEVLCVLEPSELFSYDTLVSFYYKKDQVFEQLIGCGIVINIQEDKKVQVILQWPLEGYQDIVEGLSNNDASILAKMIVKPHVPKHFLEKLRELGG